MTPDFAKAQDAATKLLLLQDINNLFIDVRTFVFDRNIIIDSVQNYSAIVDRPITDFACSEFGGSGLIKHPSGWNIVLYDDKETNQERKHWGIVHEIGHIYCDHEKDERKEEIEAHYFAAQIVMPEIALYEIAKIQGSINAFDIYAFFNASYTSCSKRIGTMQKRLGYSCSDIDRALLEKLRPLIEENFLGSASDFMVEQIT